MLTRIVMTTALTGLLAAGTTSVQAQQPTSSGQQAADPSGWTFNIAPYGWFANLNVTSNLPLPPALGGTLSTSSSADRLRRGLQTGWAGVSLTYRYLSFEQGSSAVLEHLSIKSPRIMANLTF